MLSYEMTALEQGRQAYFDYLSSEHNPYPEGSKEWEDWNEGYDRAWEVVQILNPD